MAINESIEIEQELNNIEKGIRELKIEFERFFNGGRSRVPNDVQWRVETLIKRYSDFANMSFAQRFRYNSLVAKYHSYKELWQKNLRAREEGRPIYGPFAMETPVAAEPAVPKEAGGGRLICQLVCSNPDSEEEKLQNLFKSLVEAKRECGEKPDTVQFDSFKRFLSEKTLKLKDQFKCSSVCYTVAVESGKVKFTAKGVTS
jgi:hypothetical protein